MISPDVQGPPTPELVWCSFGKVCSAINSRVGVLSGSEWLTKYLMTSSSMTIQPKTNDLLNILVTWLPKSLPVWCVPCHAHFQCWASPLPCGFRNDDCSPVLQWLYSKTSSWQATGSTTNHPISMGLNNKQLWPRFIMARSNPFAKIIRYDRMIDSYESWLLDVTITEQSSLWKPPNFSGDDCALRFCATCNIFRPPRSKHCSFCPAAGSSAGEMGTGGTAMGEQILQKNR